MANLGISNASYYTDSFIYKLNKEVNNRVDRLSTAQANLGQTHLIALLTL